MESKILDLEEAEAQVVLEHERLRVAERELAEAGQRFRRLFNQANDAILVHPPPTAEAPGKFVEVNDTACKLLGFTREELLTFSFKDLVGLEGELDLPGLGARLDKEKQVLFEATLGCKDKSRLVGEVNSTLTDLAGKPMVLSIVRNITARKEAEAQAVLEYERLLSAEKDMAEAGQRFSQLFNQANDAILVHPPPTAAAPGKFIEVNDTACKLLGFTREELLAFSFKDLVVLEGELDLPGLGARLDKEKQVLFEATLGCKDKSRLVGEVNSTLTDLAGQPVVLSIVRDITVRKETEAQAVLEYERLLSAEKDLAEAGQRYRQLFNQTDDAILVHPPPTAAAPGKFIEVNDTACKLLGFTREELLTFSFKDLVGPEGELDLPGLGARLDKEKQVLFEATLGCKDKSQLIGEVNSTLTDLAAQPMVLSIVRDITARKEAEAQAALEHERLLLAEKELAEAGQRYRQLFNQTNDAIFVHPPPTAAAPGKFIEVNDTACKLLGFTREELLTFSFKDLLAPGGELDLPGLGARLDKEKQVLFEASLGCKDKRQLIGEVNSTLTDLAGQPMVLSIVRDITALKEAEQRIIPEDLEKAYADLMSTLQKTRDITARKEAERHVALEPERLKPAEKDLMEAGQRYRQLFNQANDPILVHPPPTAEAPGKFTEVNDTACKLLGFTREELLTFSFKDLVGPEGELDLPGLGARLDKEKQVLFEASLGCKDGRRLVGEVNATLTDLAGQPMVLSIVRDITARKEAEAHAALERERLRPAEKEVVEAEPRIISKDLETAYADLKITLQKTVESLASAMEMRGPDSAGHQLRVANLSVAIARKLGLPQEQMEGIHLGALLIDLGLLNIKAEFLAKPTPLSDLEKKLVQRHPRHGYDILKGIKFPWPIAKMVLQHHERLDGSGYPQGLPAMDIILEARILGVADVVEAITSDRPYRAALGVGDAIKDISANRGTLYDPQAVDACVELLKDESFTF